MIDYRVGFGYDSHRFASEIPFFLGGVNIPSEKGCVAHSDGDALIHALCDALLGAAALDDIGTHFPDNDPSLKNIDSTILLKKVVEIVKAQEFQIQNMDASIILERPKLAPFVPLIRQSLSKLLEIEETRISIKAKTNEKMGFVGREEGIAVYVVVMIKKSYER